MAWKKDKEFDQGIGTKRREVCEEIANMKVHIEIPCETKKKGRSADMINNYIHFYSGSSSYELKEGQWVEATFYGDVNEVLE